MIKQKNKGLFKKLKNKYLNLMLYKKIVILVLFAVVLNLIGTCCSISLLQYYNSKLLYESIATTVQTGSDIISDKLSEIEKMTDIMVSDNRIQKNLTISSDSLDNELKNEAFLTLNFLIPDYYMNYRSNNIVFINLYTDNYDIYSNIALSNKVPRYVLEYVVNKAHESSGMPVWVTDYNNNYGLFLARDIRKAENMELTTLGTVLVNVDIGDLINDSINTSMFTDPAGFILMQDNNPIYYSDTIESDFVLNIDEDLKNENYGVVRKNNDEYFYISNIIPKFGLKLVCLIPYDKLFYLQNMSIILIIGINFFCILVIFFIARKIINSITRHFSILVNKMELFAKSNIYVPEENYNYYERNDEIGQLHRSFDDMVVEHNALIDEIYEKEILTRDAKIKALENQINPHFLYNTLATINAMAKSNEVSLMIESLSSLLRNTLSTEENTTSTLSKELNIVDSYVKIMKMRFRDKLEVRININENLNTVKLPNLTLQPLVENAVNYTMQDIFSDNIVTITAYVENEDAFIEISNTGSNFEDDLLEKLEKNMIKARGNGIGILNIQRRIQLVYGVKYGLSFYNIDEDNAVVVVKVPLEGKCYD